jgi:aryl-alcohol dehydrogenase-like predicted oxidoreductase
MPHSFNKIWVHAIWATKERMPLIHQNIRAEQPNLVSRKPLPQGRLAKMEPKEIKGGQQCSPFVFWSINNSIATEKNATPAQIALGWLLAQKPFIVPIPGTSKLHRLQENIGAANIILTTDELSKINAALATIKIIGERYPAQIQEATGRK